MSSEDDTFYSLRRLHRIFAASALALVAATVWMLWADYARSWKTYQRTYRDEIEPQVLGAETRSPGWGRRIARWPVIDAWGRDLAVKQIWLPELTVDYSFRQVPRVDRCTTCHVGIDVAALAGGKTGDGTPIRQPFRAHPRLELFVGAHSPHPLNEFGCTVCHEGQGSATEFTLAAHRPNDPAQRQRWRSEYGWTPDEFWDYPMLPPRLQESRCLICHHQVTDLEPSRRFPDPPAAKVVEGYQLVRQYGCFGCHEISGYDQAGRSVGPDLRLAPEAGGTGPKGLPPGTMVKVGANLGDVARRLSTAFLVDFIGDPRHFRPDTRMPQVFGLHQQLTADEATVARRLEAVEIRGIAEYLRAVGTPAELAAAPAEVTESPSTERGKKLFELRGCLACHRHAAFPAGQATEGPDLSQLGAKYATPESAAWLTSWLRDPRRHAPRTRMPNMLLEPVAASEQAFSRPAAADHSGAGKSKISDPAADLAAWLLADRGWQPAELPPVIERDLDELTALYVRASVPREKSEEYVAQGVPAADLPLLPRDLADLAAPVSLEKKLRYVGRSTIRRRGCFGCHEIPGFEQTPPIGPALSQWGRKPTSLLAFEQVHRFQKEVAAKLLPPLADAADAARRGFFDEALAEHRREGFAWQKLRFPRSFDYLLAAQKPYLERLTMGQFNFTDAQREAVVTFVLGLVGRAPAAKYVYQGDARQQAIVAGRKVLERHACATCHMLELERWTFSFDAAHFPPPPPTPDYPFVEPQIPPAALAASRTTDARGQGRAAVVGLPRLDAGGRLQEEEDDDGRPQYAFTLWQPAAINGQVWKVGGADVLIGQAQLITRRPAEGGDFARLLYPRAVAEAKAAGAVVGPNEAWSWGPPPLAGAAAEGAKVQPGWLYDYLLNPHVIRPATLLRMPQFGLAPGEARTLVNYFAALADGPFPNDPPAAPPLRLPEADAALRLIADRQTYCAKCHLIGDYAPGGELATILAPNLENVGRRIRPDYLRRWLAHPKALVPYTPMPVNFPPSGESLSPTLHPGDARRQLDAVWGLLLNYQEYFSRRTSIRRLVETEEGGGKNQAKPAAGPGH